MARIEEDREDLMKEATALVRRMELQIDNVEEVLFTGYKRNDNLSIYFTQDLVYHYDDKYRLRRVFLKPHLYRSEGDSLTKMARVRTDSTSELHTSQLSEEELKQFQAEMLKRIQNLIETISKKQYQILKQIPEDIDLITEFVNSLKQVVLRDGELSPPIVKR